MTSFRSKYMLPLSVVHTVLAFLFGLAVDAIAFEATHTLDVQLTPTRARLDGIDRITVTGHSGPK